MKFCMRGRVREIVIYFKFHENRSRGLRAVEVENRPLPLTWPMAYTTACTTVQAVKTLHYICTLNQNITLTLSTNESVMWQIT